MFDDFFTVLIATVVLSYNVIFPLLGLQMNQAATARITRHPQWLQMLIFARAAVVEEILYRGYRVRQRGRTGQRRHIGLLQLDRHRPGGAAVTLAHLAGWGGAQLIVVGFGAVILGLLYLWRRDLPCNMLAHFLVDAVSFAST